MKIYGDENIEAGIVEGLRRRNLQVVSAQDRGDLGKSDEYHLQRASRYSIM